MNLGRLPDEMGNWQLYGSMIVSIAADAMGSDPEMIDDMDADDQLALCRQWYDADGWVMRCPECWRVYTSRVKICEMCGVETHRDHWLMDGVGKMLGVLVARGEE